MSRLDDLRDEIQRLLYKLQRQAKAAEKYHELRKDEKEAQLLLLGAKWIHLAPKSNNCASFSSFLSS